MPFYQSNLLWWADMARYISIPLWKQHRSTLDQHAKPEYRSGLAYLHDYNSAERLDMSMTGNFVMKNATSPF
jgi:hypothetical protein